VANLWGVYWVNQARERANSDPKQPLDPSKDRRMYVVVAPPMHRREATCCPIQNNAGGSIRLTEVDLVNGYGRFITKDSKIICHQVFTFPIATLSPSALVGSLSLAEQDKVKTALREFFRI